MTPRFLSFSSSVPRWPLTKWEAQVKPLAMRPPKDAILDAWCVANNHLALIALHRGDPDGARGHCTRQIDGLMHLSASDRAHRDPAVFAVQPLVNLVRLTDRSAQTGLFSAIAQTPRPDAETLGALPVDPDHIHRILGSAHKDPKVRNFLGNLAAKSRASTAFATQDRKGIAQAIDLSHGAFRQELEFLAQVFWPMRSSGDTAPPADPLIRSFHLVMQNDVATAPATTLARTVIARLRDKAAGSGNAFELDAAISMLGHVLDTGPDPRARSNRTVFDSLLKQARHMQDEMAQITLGHLGVRVFGRSRSALRRLIAASEYRAARAMTG